MTDWGTRPRDTTADTSDVWAHPSPGPATLAVRPHRLRLTTGDDAILRAECRRAAYLGSRIEYVLATPWGDLLVFDAGIHAPLARGASVGVAFAPEDAIVLQG